MRLPASRSAAALLAAGFLAAACSDDPSPTGTTATIALRNTSNAPALARSFVPGIEIFSLVGSDDTLPQSPSYVFGGSADGAGVLRSQDGTGFTILVNHEDNFGVSRITLDNAFRPVKGEWVMNSTFGLWRLCSATLATPEVHGFGPTYLTVGESGEESMIHALPAFGAPNSNVLAEGLGKWNGENAVPLTKEAYPGKTVILIGDDDSSNEGGHVGLYVSDVVGDLRNGKLYVLRRTDRVQREMSMVTGQTYPAEWVEIPNHRSLTGRQINQFAFSNGAPVISRVEDLDYRKGSAANNREIYFNATGQNNTGNNADYSRTKYGRTYRLALNPTSPTGPASLELIADGDDKATTNAARLFQNPDNIYVGQNYVYIQEDANGYGDETHDAYIWQYNIATRELRPVIELDHRRTRTDGARFNVRRTGTGATATYDAIPGNASVFGSWEYGAMEDVSDLLGQPNTFLVAIQPHTWIGARYRGVDGGTLRPNEDQASQLVLIKGLPR